MTQIGLQPLPVTMVIDVKIRIRNVQGSFVLVFFFFFYIEKEMLCQLHRKRGKRPMEDQNWSLCSLISLENPTHIKTSHV